MSCGDGCKGCSNCYRPTHGGRPEQSVAAQYISQEVEREMQPLYDAFRCCDGKSEVQEGCCGRPIKLESALPPFDEVWAKQIAAGHRYGKDALEQVRFGYELARRELKT